MPYKDPDPTHKVLLDLLKGIGSTYDIMQLIAFTGEAVKQILEASHYSMLFLRPQDDILSDGLMWCQTGI